MIGVDHIQIPEQFIDDIETAVRILKEAGCTEIYLS